MWEDPRVWAHWNYTFDMHLNYLWPKYVFLHWNSPQGTPWVGWRGARLQWLMVWWRATFFVNWSAGDILCPHRSRHPSPLGWGLETHSTPASLSLKNFHTKSSLSTLYYFKSLIGLTHLISSLPSLTPTLTFLRSNLFCNSLIILLLHVYMYS